MTAPALQRTRPSAVFASLVAKAIPSELLVVGALSTPAEDLAGDVVRPQGLDFSPHSRSPEIDLEHARTPHGPAVVAWARKSLAKPGDYSTAWSTVDYAGAPTRLPFGHAYFDPSDRLQHQTFALYDRGALTGFSLEFRPVEFKSRGFRSPLEPRDAMEFTRASVVRYTCCAVPVCPDAIVVDGGVVRKAVPRGQVPALCGILSAGRIGSEQLHPLIAKALAHHLPPTKYHRVTEAKSMNDTDTVYDAAAPETEMPAPADESGAPAQGGIAALYAKTQALLDACDQNEQDMETSDSPDLRKFAAKIRDKVRAIAEEVKSMADKHDAKLNGTGDAPGPDGVGVQVLQPLPARGPALPEPRTPNEFIRKAYDSETVKKAATGHGRAGRQRRRVPGAADVLDQDLRAGVQREQPAAKTDQYTAGGNVMVFPRNNESSRATGSRWGGVRAYWVQEGSTVTASAPTFGQLTPAAQQARLPGAGDEELLKRLRHGDGRVPDPRVRDGDRVRRNNAIFRGTGAGQPLGLLNAPCAVSVAKETGQAAATIVPPEHREDVGAAVRARAHRLLRLAHQPGRRAATLPHDPRHRHGRGDDLHAAGRAVGAPYSTLMGAPIMEVEFASTLGTVGDIVLVDLARSSASPGDAVDAARLHVYFTTRRAGVHDDLPAGRRPVAGVAP
jgi:HK97 family phage major capsid protein